MKKLISILLVITILAAFTTAAFAADSVTIHITESVEGSSVSYTISLENPSAITIGAVQFDVNPSAGITIQSGSKGGALGVENYNADAFRYTGLSVMGTAETEFVLTTLTASADDLSAGDAISLTGVYVYDLDGNLLSTSIVNESGTTIPAEEDTSIPNEDPVQPGEEYTAVSDSESESEQTNKEAASAANENAGAAADNGAANTNTQGAQQSSANNSLSVNNSTAQSSGTGTVPQPVGNNTDSNSAADGNSQAMDNISESVSEDSQTVQDAGETAQNDVEEAVPENEGAAQYTYESADANTSVAAAENNNADSNAGLVFSIIAIIVIALAVVIIVVVNKVKKKKDSNV